MAGNSRMDYCRLLFRKKMAFHPVRRAYLPVTTVVVTENDSVKFFGVNDSPADWNGTMRYGIFKLAGGMVINEVKDVTIRSNTSVLLASVPESQWVDRKQSGVFSLLMQEGKTVAQYRLFTERFKDLIFADPAIKISRSGNEIILQSPTFVWGACIDINGEKPITDNCFDLLPGIPYTIPWTEKELPKIQFTGNSIFKD